MLQHQTNHRPTHEGILILDYGSQYTLLIARRLREIGVYAEVISGTANEAPKDFHWFGAILSGGPDSTVDDNSRDLPPWLFIDNKPILGICYGLQLIAKHFSCKVRSGLGREYGEAKLLLPENNIWPLWARSLQDLPKEQSVWMSHGDDIESGSAEFNIVGKTSDGIAAIFAHEKQAILGLQFHPEVEHSQYGKKILEIFACEICQANRNWFAKDILEATISYIQRSMMPESESKYGHVLMAVSGGVDSTVSLALMSRALGPEHVTGVFVDHGLLRENEADWVQSQLQSLGVNLITLNRQDIFLEKLAGITDPEAKRKIIGRQFIEEFESFAEARKCEGQIFTHLGQGTLYPDVIESAGHGHGSHVIKSHHNVGGLPEKLNLKLIEPFRYLFKDEVRQIGDSLGLSKDLVYRHPFPGPGLAVRIIGDITAEKVHILQKADSIFISQLRKHGFYDKVWQAFAVLLPVRSVGVMGDQRTYELTCALRAVCATDGMTAGVGDLPLAFLVQTGDKIVRHVPGINRVVYDVTSKPPATIEWE